jgi:hypothetical protein
MPRIALKQIEIFIGQRLDLFGKAIVMLQKDLRARCFTADGSRRA